MKKSSKMLFLYRGWNSGTNQAILNTWQEISPHLHIIHHDVSLFANASLFYRLSLCPRALKYKSLLHLVRTPGAFTDTLKRTEWCMKKIHAHVSHIAHTENFDFAFCVGTVIPMLNFPKPYFIYTDLAIRSNYAYPGAENQVQLWQECLPFEEQTLHHAKMIFTMSDHVTRSLQEHYHLPASKILRVNGGCNVPCCLSPKPDRFYRQNILFVGVDWQRKGGPELLAAFRQLRSTHPHATLTIVGCSPKITGEGIKVIGPVPQNLIPDYFAAATLFCMPSRREPFGIAYIEAMHAGLPVIASCYGAAPDFVRNGLTGYTVKPTDTTTLVQRLAELITNPDLCHKMGQAGKKLVAAEYTWSKTCTKMESAIQNSLQS